MVVKIIKSFGVVTVLILVLGLASACSQARTPTSEAAGEIPKRSNPGGPGEAVNLTGIMSLNK